MLKTNCKILALLLTAVMIMTALPMNIVAANSNGTSVASGKYPYESTPAEKVEKESYLAGKVSADNAYKNIDGNLEQDYEPGVVLVGFKKAYSKSSLNNLFRGISIVEVEDQGERLYEAVKEGHPEEKGRLSKLEAEIGKDYVVKISEKTKEGVLKAIEIIKKDPNVAYAIPNYLIEPCVTPNDYTNFALTGLDRIQAPLAWDTYTGSLSVNVGIIDTGIDNTHPDLIDNVNMSLAYDAHNENSDDTFDYNSHGTHVAGIVGAKGHNSIGVVGVNWNVRLVPIKIVADNSGAGGAYADTMVNAVHYAIAKNIPICNMSYGTPDYAAFENAIREYDGLFVISAGNDGKNVDENAVYTRLNALGNVIFVANANTSTGVNEALSSSSNYGVNNVAIAAPGTFIISTIPLSGPGRGSETGYASKSGTSMAAPFVAGVAALLKGKYPSMTTAQIKAAILDGVDCVPKIQGLVATGRLNAYNTINRTYDSDFLMLQPNNGETMKAAILRTLGTRSASQITSIKLLGTAAMDPNSTLDVSASGVLPNLVNIDLSSFGGSIETSAFHSCTKVTTVIFPKNEFKLPAFCFMNCSNLKTIYRANNAVRTLNEADFTGMKLVDGTNAPIAVQTQCFQGCTSLTTIRMPNTGKLRFAQFAFKGCTSLRTIYLDSFNKVVGEADLTEMSHIRPSVFEETAFSSVKLPKDVEISGRAFRNCTSLTKIQIHPAQTSVTTIGAEAFYGVNSSCQVYTNQQLKNNTSFVFPFSASVNLPKQINSLVVWHNASETIASAIGRYLGSTSASAIKHLVVIGSAALGNSVSTTSANILPNIETADLSLYTSAIPKYMFFGCTNLKLVIRNENHAAIPAQCFMNCSNLTTILVAEKYPKVWGEADLSDLTGSIAINTQAFESCTSLTTIMFPSTQLGIPRAFYGCSNLSTIYKEGTQKESGVFDLTGVTTFWLGWGENFYGTRVSEVRLPLNVDIAEKMFYNCSNLAKIYFDRSQTLVVTIGAEAFYNVNSSCEAYMHNTLVTNTTFVLPRSSTTNIVKKAY